MAAEGRRRSSRGDGDGRRFGSGKLATLKPKWIQSPDGAREFYAFYDSLLDLDCNFTWMSGDVLRCAPLDDYRITPRAGAYADWNCSVPAAIRQKSACAPTPTYAVSEGVACHRFEMASELGAPTASWYFDVGYCSNASNSALWEAFLLGAEMQPSQFVMGQLKTGPELSGLAPISVEAADGARAFWRLYDTVHGFDCAFDRAADGLQRCFPVDEAYWIGYSDPACTARAAEFAPCGSPPRWRGGLWSYALGTTGSTSHSV